MYCQCQQALLQHLEPFCSPAARVRSLLQRCPVPGHVLVPVRTASVSRPCRRQVSMPFHSSAARLRIGRPCWKCLDARHCWMTCAAVGRSRGSGSSIHLSKAFQSFAPGLRIGRPSWKCLDARHCWMTCAAVGRSSGSGSSIHLSRCGSVRPRFGSLYADSFFCSNSRAQRCYIRKAKLERLSVKAATKVMSSAVPWTGKQNL